MIVGQEEVYVAAAVKTGANLGIPASANGATLQAVGNNIRYTMDNVTVPTTVKGMRLLVGLAPEEFLVEDLKRLKFIAEAGDATLLIHYYGGRADWPTRIESEPAIATDFLPGGPLARPW